jgi:excisionase family DNA binding protein
MNAMVSQELLTVRDVAERLNVSVDTVRRYVRRGDLPIVRLGSGPAAPIRIRPDAVTRFIRNGEEASA